MACGGDEDSVGPTELDISICDPTSGPFTTAVDNPFFPLDVGRQWALDGVDEGAVVHLDITVLNETEVVAGVTTRVVEERETEDDVLVEISRNFFAQAPDGTVCYFGEDVEIYDETGTLVVSNEGAWRADENMNHPGIIMPTETSLGVGVEYDQEAAPEIAEDHALIVARGNSIEVSAGTFTDTLETRETSPLEPGVVSAKVYARGVGLVVDDVLELTNFF